MSHWMKLVSDLKRRQLISFLTPSQRYAHDQICEWLSIPERINLHGLHGSGKTFVAWALTQTMNAHFVALPENLNKQQNVSEVVIIDNAPHNEQQVRRLMANGNLLGISSMIFVTRTPINMPIRNIGLALPTEEEVLQVETSLDQLGYSRYHRLPDFPNFWNILAAHV